MANAKRESKSAEASYIQDQEKQKVRGIFRFFEVPNGVLEFSFLKYKGDSVENYKLFDGQVYELPLSVARHLNSSGKYPVHEFSNDPAGKSSVRNIVRVGYMKSRYGFQSLEFTEIPGLENPTATSVVQVHGA